MRTNRTAGFTLIEVLVIAPIVILFIGAFVGLIVSLTGDSLQTRANNEVAYQVRNALDIIESENARSSENYPATTGTLTSPQGLNNDTTAFTVTNNDTSTTDNDVLIIKSPATTLDAVNPSRNLIRYNSPNACAAINVNDNPYYPITTVFFVASGTLWQRTILPSSGTPCSTPWQKASCAESQSLTGVCKVYDSKLAESVSSFSVKYLDASGIAVSSADPTSAKVVDISIQASKTVAGKTVTYTGNIRSSSSPTSTGTSYLAISRSLSAGASHSCAMFSAKVYCWGYRSYGSFGDGTAGGSSSFWVPRQTVDTGVLSGKTVTNIDAGGLTTCAVAQGLAYCWGNNSFGQVGDGTTTNAGSPVAVQTSGVLSGKVITDISSSGNTTCAIASGKAYCWGYGGYGALGNGAANSSSLPVAVSDTGVLSGKIVTQIAAGGNTTCAVASGKAYCWGSGANGLGNGSTSDSSSPVAVSDTGVLSGKTVTDIDVSPYHICVVASGKAYCWGYGGYGELGNGSTGNSTLPVAVTEDPFLLSGKTVTDITTSYYSTCAVADGKAYCWGYNVSGEVGDGTTTNRTVPVAVSTSGVLSGKTIVSIDGADGGYFMCASDSTYSYYCWGSNNLYQLGNGSVGTGNSSVPLSVTTP